MDPTDNVVSLGDRYVPVIRLGSRRVLTDEQCVDLREQILSTVKAVGDGADLLVNKYQFSDISFGMCLCLMSWVQQVHSAAVVARSLGCQCDTEMPTGRTLTET